jgi:tRNA-binding EMAP/Myf-like protein
VSSLVVEVCKVNKVQKHPNADNLSIIDVKGWQVCSNLDPVTKQPRYKEGDKCVYIPPDSVLPKPLADRQKLQGFSKREGIVIKPVEERNATVDGKAFGRVILKSVSFDYLNRKGGTEDH